MKRAILLCLALAACDTPLGTEIARKQAKQVVNEVVQDKFPGVNAAPVTDCIIDNASGSEIIDLAGDAVTGVTDQTVVLVLEIATRPDSITCYVENVGPLVVADILAGT